MLSTKPLIRSLVCLAGLIFATALSAAIVILAPGRALAQTNPLTFEWGPYGEQVAAGMPTSIRNPVERIRFAAPVHLAAGGQDNPVTFDWRQFGAQAVANADHATKVRLAQSTEERVKFIARKVGRQLNLMKVMPNTNYIERGVSWTKHGAQGLGTCDHVTDSLKDAMIGGGVEDRRLVRVFGEKGGARSLNLFDVNRTHVALAYIREDGSVATYDLWAHGGEHQTFGGFDQSIWNGQDVANWSKVMEKYGYSRQGCEDCLDRSAKYAYLFLQTLVDQAETLAREAKIVPVGTVRFFVRDNTTMKPLANAQVIVSGAINSPSERFRGSGTTNAAGTVDIPGIVLGVYTVTAHHASCPSFESGLTNIKPRETQGIPMVCGQPAVPASSTGRRGTQPGPPSGAGSDEQVVAEYRSLLPRVLAANKKPWHTRINLIANAVRQGAGYRVNYQTYCLIEQGPDKGKDHMCFEYDNVLDLGGVKSAVADMRRQLGL